MTPLKANLKIFYQCPPLLVAYALILCGVMPFWFLVMGAVAGPPQGGVLGLLVPVAFVVGLLVSSVLRDVLSKPFTFVLPGHEPIVKRTVGVVGGWLALAMGFALLCAASGPALSAAGIFLASLAIAMAAYLAGVAVVFAPSWVRRTAMVLVPTVVLFVCFGIFLRAFYQSFAESLHHYSAAWLLAGLVVSTVALPWFRAERLARGVCGRSWIVLAGAWAGNTAKMERARRERLARRAGPPSATPTLLDRVLLPRLARNGPAGLARDVWGEAYGHLSRYRPLRVLSWVLPILIYCCLMAGLSSTMSPPPVAPLRLSNFISLGADLPILLAPCLLLPFASPFVPTLLLASGRRERFRREVVTGVLLFVALFGAVVLVVLLCRWVFPALPLVTVWKHTFALRPPDLWAVPALLWTVPAFLAMRFAGPRHKVLFLGLPAQFLSIFGYLWLPFLTTLPVASVLLIGVGVWALYVALVWHIAMRRDWVA